MDGPIIRSNMCCLRHRRGVGTSFYMRVPNSGKPLRTQIFRKPILSVSEYEGMSAGSFMQFAEKSGRFETRVQLNLNYGVHIRPN
jgi:hypothetical protein